MIGKFNQIKGGVLLSYILIGLNTVYAIAILPFIIRNIGAAEYGVYKTISSLAASLMIIDMGIGGTVQRYVAKYITDNERRKIPNFIAMYYIQALILSLILLLVSFLIYCFLTPMYGETFDHNQMQTAKIVFALMIISLVFQIFGDVSNGVIVGHNDFIFGNGIKLLRLIVRIAAIYFLLHLYKNATVLACIDLFLSIIVLVAQQIYITTQLRLSIKLNYWDKVVFYESAKYTLLMFLTTVASQISINADNMIIGAYYNPSFVTVYSIGLLFFSMFQNISGAVAGVMLPTVTNALAEVEGTKKVVNIIIQAGRFQFMLLGAGIIGFFCIGEDFINIWLGNGYKDVYLITLLLIIPSIFELCINVCLSVLRAKNKLGFRTVVLSVCTIVKIVITILLVKNWSYIGAAIGTAVSYILGSLIIMNLYYTQIIGLPMIYIYKNIIKGIWFCLLISGIVLFMTTRYIYGNYLSITINSFIFAIVYVALLIKLDCFPLKLSH